MWIAIILQQCVLVMSTLRKYKWVLTIEFYVEDIWHLNVLTHADLWADISVLVAEIWWTSWVSPNIERNSVHSDLVILCDKNKLN